MFFVTNPRSCDVRSQRAWVDLLGEQEIPIVSDKRRTFERLFRRAVVSLLDAEGAVMRNLLSQPGSQLVATMCQDDTNHKIRLRQKKTRGGIVTTTWACLQDLCVRSRDQAGGLDLRTVSLPCPLLFLRHPNAATLAAAMAHCGAIQPSGRFGSLWGRDGGDQQQQIHSDRLHALVVIADSASTNIAMFRQLHQQQGDHVCMLLVRCCMHQSSLSKKPCMLAFNGMTTNLIRLGHLCAASSFVDRFHLAVHQLVQLRLRYTVVVSLPAETLSARMRLGTILRETVASPVPLALEVELLEFFHSHPDRTVQLEHFCSGGPSCCKSRRDAVAKATRLLTGMLTPCPGIPLLYRWKGWDASVAWCRRGFMWRVLPQILCAMQTKLPASDTNPSTAIGAGAAPSSSSASFAPMRVDDVAAEVLADIEGDENATPAALQGVRLQRASKWFTNPHTPGALTEAALLSEPFDRLADRLFHACRDTLHNAHDLPQGTQITPYMQDAQRRNRRGVFVDMVTGNLGLSARPTIPNPPCVWNHNHTSCLMNAQC